MNDLQRQINDLVDTFVAGITRLARKAAMDTLTTALDGGAAAPRAPRAAAPAAPSRPRGRPAARGKGQKRDPKEIERVQLNLEAHIMANPGQRIEQIKSVLGIDTKDLVLPIKKLLEMKKIRTEGERRATKYFPAEGGGNGDGAAQAKPARGRRAKKK